MPYIKHTSAFSKFRLLISGFSQSGKTTSFPTFLYGPFDYQNPEEQDEATEYAAGKHMDIVVCPGEFGIRSLPADTPNMHSYYYETSPTDDTQSKEWSEHSVNEFDKCLTAVIKDQPDILCVDGIHTLWSHLMNVNTDGDFLQGADLSINPATGSSDKYRAARFYNQTHNVFGQYYIARLYNSAIPLVVVTTWEEWETGKTEGDKPGAIGDTRYLWPAIPGSMARAVVGKFDARVSAKLSSRCLHSGCQDSKESVEHFVWQFYPRGDVQGVGIKGLKMTRAMKDKPYVHQNWHDLKGLIETFS